MRGKEGEEAVKERKDMGLCACVTRHLREAQAREGEREVAAEVQEGRSCRRPAQRQRRGHGSHGARA